MGAYFNEIKEAIEVTGVNARLIDKENSEGLWKRIVEKFTNAKLCYSWLWESYLNYVSVYGIMSYEWIASYLQHRPCYFLVNDNYNRKIVYYFEDGSSVVDMYGETSENLEFYVTDEELTFLLGFNHECYLSACGDAKNWLINYAKENGLKY